jgi:hypothetical protein
VQNCDELPTHRDRRRSQVPKRGSEQTTAPGCPQIEFAAQLTIRPRQRFGMRPLSASCFVTFVTHSTNLPWFVPVHGHAADTSARTAQRAESHAASEPSPPP